MELKNILYGLVIIMFVILLDVTIVSFCVWLICKAIGITFAFKWVIVVMSVICLIRMCIPSSAD